MARLTEDQAVHPDSSSVLGERRENPGMRRVRRQGMWLVSAAVVVLVSAGVLLLIADGDGSEETPQAAPRATVAVVRRDLVERETLDGALGYADASSVVTRIPGTLTWIADEGGVVGRGDILFRVSNRPVVLLYGALPAWRALADGVENGPDVRQLERNLVALGYDPDGEIEVDAEFDTDTENAVEEWKDDLGLDGDGVVQHGDIVFFPGRVRVGQHVVEAGSPIGPGSPTVEISAVERIVTVELDADRQDLVTKGDTVQVELPDGDPTSGRVTDIGSVAQTDPQDPEATPFIEITIALRGENARRGLDQAPVEVDISTERRRNVLAVPVSALLALAEGGYGLEVVEGAASTRLIRVETGLYADGYVEVSGEDLTEGLEVVVPE